MLKKLKKLYTLKKLQNFTVIFTIEIFLRNFARFSVKNFALCKKNHVFNAKYCRKIFSAKITAKIYEKNKRKTYLIPLLLGWQQSQQNVVAFFLQKNFRGVVYDNDIKGKVQKKKHKKTNKC